MKNVYRTFAKYNMKHLVNHFVASYVKEELVIYFIQLDTDMEIKNKLPRR